MAGPLADVEAGDDNRRHQGRNVHERIKRCRPGLIGNLGGIQLWQHRRESGAAHGAEQAACGHGVRHFDARQFGQGVSADQNDHDAESHGGKRRQKDLGKVGVANGNASTEADLQ